MHDTGCLGLVHWDDPERWDGEGGGRGVQVGEHIYTHGRFMSMYGKPIQYCKVKNQINKTEKKKKKKKNPKPKVRRFTSLRKREFFQMAFGLEKQHRVITASLLIPACLSALQIFNFPVSIIP